MPIGLFGPCSRQLISLIARIVFPVLVDRKFGQKPRKTRNLREQVDPKLPKNRNFPVISLFNSDFCLVCYGLGPQPPGFSYERRELEKPVSCGRAAVRGTQGQRSHTAAYALTACHSNSTSGYLGLAPLKSLGRLRHNTDQPSTDAASTPSFPRSGYAIAVRRSSSCSCDGASRQRLRRQCRRLKWSSARVLGLHQIARSIHHSGRP